MAAAAAFKQAHALDVSSIAWALPESSGQVELTAAVAAIVEGTILASYRFDRFHTTDEDDAKTAGIDRLALVASEGADTDALAAEARFARTAARRRQPRTRAAGPAGEHPEPHLPRGPGPADLDRLRAGLGRGHRQGGNGGGRDGRPGRRLEGHGGGAGPDRPSLRRRRRGRACPGARRQGRHLRLRRDLHQALGEDGGDEVRHVGRAPPCSRRSRRSPSSACR